MAYVSRFEYDVFVSYAQVDDQSDSERGWVSTLVHKLTNRLAQLLGRRESLAVFMDHQLRRHSDITLELSQKVQNSAVMLSVLSPGYLASPWCRQELETFVKESTGLGRSGLPVFVVERDCVELERRPAALADKLGYRFWAREAGNFVRILGEPLPLPDDREYYKVLDRLAREIADELISYCDGESEAAEAEEASSETVTVYVADVTDDLDAEWNDVKNALKQRNLRVLPTVAYPRDPESFCDAVSRDLEQADLCVQLLSTVRGRGLERTNHTTVSYQASQAAELKIPLLQWRHPSLEYSQLEALVPAGGHRQLLKAAYACDLSEFIPEVLRQSQKKRRPIPLPTDGPGGAFIFVNVAEDDDPLAEELCDFLAAQGYDVVKPIQGAQADEFRQAFESNFLDCDAVIVVRGAAHDAWVQRQLIAARKLTYKREKPLFAMALYEGPPPRRAGDLGLWLRNLQVIPCYDGLAPESLQPFVEAIERGIRDARAGHDPAGESSRHLQSKQKIA